MFGVIIAVNTYIMMNLHKPREVPPAGPKPSRLDQPKRGRCCDGKSAFQATLLYAFKPAKKRKISAANPSSWREAQSGAQMSRLEVLLCWHPSPRKLLGRMVDPAEVRPEWGPSWSRVYPFGVKPKLRQSTPKSGPKRPTSGPNRRVLSLQPRQPYSSTSKSLSPHNNLVRAVFTVRREVIRTQNLQI